MEINSPQQAAAVNLCRKFPDAPARTLARRLHNDNPAMFPRIETARSIVRAVLGVGGARHRKQGKQQKRDALYRAPRKAGWTTPIPESSDVPWEPLAIDSRRVLVLSDIHLPYHATSALSVALNHGDEFNPDCILINGDLFDFYQLSRFDKNPTKEKVSAELECGRQFFEHLRQRYKRARIVFKLGNHDERWDKYLQNAAPILFDIDAIRNAWHQPAGIQEFGVEIVQDQRLIMLGKLPVLHGHELQRGLTSPVNPARGAFLRTRDSVLIGHYHQTSDHTERSLLGTVVVARSTGCLCGLTPEYARVNRWDHGFATVAVAKDGTYDVNLKRIIEDRVH